MVELLNYLKSYFIPGHELTQGEKINFYGYRISIIVLAMGSAFYLLLFYKIAILRANYPFDLEWMEGGAVDHVRRVMDGKSLYIEPSPDFVPYIYTPLSYYVGAIFTYIFGEGYLPLRILSILSISGCFVLLGLFTYKSTKDLVLACVPPGLFAASYVLVNNWFDIGRVDSLFLCLLLLSAYVLHHGKTHKKYWISALVLYLAFMTKQSALIVFPFLAVVAFRDHWKSGLTFSLTWLITVFGTVLIYNQLSEGWFSYYIFKVGGGHEILDNMYWDFWRHDIYDKYKWPFVSSLLFALVMMLKMFKKENLIYLAMAGGFVGMSYFGRLHSGGDTNVIMPAYAIMALLSILALYRLTQHKWLKGQLFAVLVPVVFTVLMVWQYTHLRYYSANFLPTKADVEAGNKILEIIDAADGPVMVSSHGYWQYKVGKETNAHFMASYDLLRSDADHPAVKIISDSTIARIENQYYHTIIQDNDYFVGQVRQHYDLVMELEYDGDAFIPESGAKLRPLKVYVRKPR